MISLNSEQICILELIKESLFDLIPDVPEETNWEKVFECAKTQCIVPLLVSCIPAEYRNEWNNLLYHSKSHFIQMIYEQNTLINLFKENNISFVVLKGTAAAIYYPNPVIRTFGDVDIYVAKEHLKSAINLLEANRYRFIKNTAREFDFEKNGIEFELHTKFSSRHYNDIEQILISGMNNTVEYKINGASFPGLPSYENGLVLLGHIMQHLKTSGIGLRQIIDWMMFVYKELDDSAWEEHFRKLAVEAGLEKLAVTVTFMCRKWLGLTDKITWCKEADEDIADQLLIRVLDDGNFGNDRAPYENVKRCIKEEGLFKHLQSYGVENWSLARRFVFFRPFAWLYQTCRYACQGIVRLFNGKKVFKKDKQSISLEELWKELE